MQGRGRTSEHAGAKTLAPTHLLHFLANERMYPTSSFTCSGLRLFL